MNSFAPLLSHLHLWDHPELSPAGRKEIPSNPLILQENKRPRERKALVQVHTGTIGPNSGIMGYTLHNSVLKDMPLLWAWAHELFSLK